MILQDPLCREDLFLQLAELVTETSLLSDISNNVVKLYK